MKKVLCLVLLLFSSLVCYAEDYEKCGSWLLVPQTDDFDEPSGSVVALFLDEECVISLGKSKGEYWVGFRSKENFVQGGSYDIISVEIKRKGDENIIKLSDFQGDGSHSVFLNKKNSKKVIDFLRLEGTFHVSIRGYKTYNYLYHDVDFPSNLLEKVVEK